MNFDKKSLNKLLALNDEELVRVIKEIATEGGIDADTLKIGKSDILKIRMFLSMAGEEDIANLITKFGGKKQ